MLPGVMAMPRVAITLLALVSISGLYTSLNNQLPFGVVTWLSVMLLSAVCCIALMVLLHVMVLSSNGEQQARIIRYTVWGLPFTMAILLFVVPTVIAATHVGSQWMWLLQLLFSVAICGLHLYITKRTTALSEAEQAEGRTQEGVEMIQNSEGDLEMIPSSNNSPSGSPSAHLAPANPEPISIDVNRSSPRDEPDYSSGQPASTSDPGVGVSMDKLGNGNGDLEDKGDKGEGATHV